MTFSPKEALSPPSLGLGEGREESSGGLWVPGGRLASQPSSD